MEDRDILPDNFIKWACSLSGCNGGDPKAKIWISGIEWGLGSDKNNIDDYYLRRLPEEISKGAYTPPIDGYDLRNLVKYKFDASVAKLYCAIKGYEPKNYKNIIKTMNGSEIFKANLYPIAFRNTNQELWKKYKLDEVTGFKEKHLFKTWCFLNRFPAISKTISKDSPKLIICTGIGYITDFFACYAGNGNINKSINSGELDGKRRYCWAKLNNGSLLVVIPFFLGHSGLNSDKLKKEMGDKIRDLMHKYKITI